MSKPSLDDFQRQYQLLKGLDRELFQRVVRLETNVRIAHELDLSLEGTKERRGRLIEFMGAKNAIEMIELAHKAGWRE